MLVYPYLAHALLGSSETIGLFLGTAVHDTSQVVGAALTYKQIYGDDVVLRVATVTKLTRNIFLAAVIPLLTWMHVRSTHDPVRGPRKGCPGRRMSRLRGGLPGHGRGAVGGRRHARVERDGVWAVDAAGWSALTNQVGDFWPRARCSAPPWPPWPQHQLLGVPRHGLKPFAVGLAGAAVVGLVGMTMAVIFGRFVSL